MRSTLQKIYRLAQLPRLRYALPVEGIRRVFFAYDTREVMMSKIMEWASFRNLGGDYMEFGVFEGDSFIKAFHFARFARLSHMTFYAFDSFAGYPPLEGIDKECGYFQEGAYICDLETFKKKLSHGGIDMRRVRIVPGWFSELALRAKEGKTESKLASVAWIDCDLYKPTLEALDFLADYITDGTVIVFADWFTCNGASDMCQPKALSDWLAKNPAVKLVEYLTFGSKAFIVSWPEKRKTDKELPRGL